MTSRAHSSVHPAAALSLLACAVLAGSASAAPAASGSADEVASKRARADFALTADPSSAAWKGAPAVFIEKDRFGQPVPGHRTEVRSQWTPENLYLLFVSPYEQLHLKPEPATATETDKLWNWDVAEAFIGTDPKDIKKYKEFQVSPQGEWVDLDIDRGVKPARHDVSWNSGYAVKARLDRDLRVWYGEMRIPLAAIGVAPRAGAEARINLYRCQGPAEGRKYMNWRPVNNETFHTPEAFGRLRLVD